MTYIFLWSQSLKALPLGSKGGDLCPHFFFRSHLIFYTKLHLGHIYVVMVRLFTKAGMEWIRWILFTPSVSSLVPANIPVGLRTVLILVSSVCGPAKWWYYPQLKDLCSTNRWQNWGLFGALGMYPGTTTVLPGVKQGIQMMQEPRISSPWYEMAREYMPSQR